MTHTISLAELKRKKKIEVWQEDYPRYRLFRIMYMNLDGLPAYFLDFGDEDNCEEQGVSSNNAVDIIEALSERFEAVLVP